MPRQSVAKISDPLRLYLLGSFRVERANQSIRLPTHKTESLLAYLALSPRQTSHPREKLAALLWGESSDELARSSLRRALVLLRDALGHDLLLTDREAVQINPACPLWVDALEFQAQAERLLKDPHADATLLDIALYRDDLLVDYYDEWIAPWRERFRSLFIESLLKLVELARRQGDYARAVQLAQTVLQRDAANESAHQHLMFCYWKMGKRNAALSQFKECARILEQELGVQPTAETTELYDQIRNDIPTSPENRDLSLAHLPIPLTTLVGRQRELGEIKRLLPTTRLLTLTGAGGSGKTRLAIQTATEVQSDFRDGVGWVDLSELIEPSLLPHTVAHALGIYEAADVPLVQAITRYLRPRHFLLVLDNCEHLVEACAALVETMLRACPQLTVLATSRQVLDIAGETAWIVPSMSMPEPGQPILEGIEQNEAVALYVARARAALPGLELTRENWETMDRICRRLDGIPLAIELAASRVKVLSVAEIEAHLSERFTLLVSGNRAALPRHRTIRATMDWSYGLLSDPEKILLRRLAVFTGGFTLESATRVCGSEPLDSRDLLTHLSNLLDKSLILMQTRQGASRYRLLETIREYALECLLESGEGEQFHAQHLDYMIEFAQLAQSKLVGAEQLDWLHRLEAEEDNLRAAMHRAIEHPGWHAQGVQLAAALLRYWWCRGEPREGRSWLERTLAAYAAPQNEQEIKTRLSALNALGCMEWFLDDNSTARARLEQNVQHARELQDKETAGYALGWLSMFVNDQGEYELARAYAEESIRMFDQTDAWGLAYAFFVRGKAALSLQNLDEARLFYEASADQFRKLGDRWGRVLPLGHLGVMALRQGDYARARQLLSERLSIAREFRSRQLISYATANLGRICIRTGEQERARQFLNEGLQVAVAMGSQGQITELIDGLAELAAALEQNQRAVRLSAVFERERQIIPMQRDAQEQQEYAARLDGLRVRMGEQAFAEAWAQGQAMPLEHAVRYARATD